MSTKISATKSKILYGSRPLVLANGVDFAAINVRVRDEDDAPVAKQIVQLVPDRADVTISISGDTDENGLITGYIKSEVTGPVTLRARVVAADSREIETTTAALQELAKNSAGAVWIDGTLTVNFYSRDIEPQPALAVTSQRNINIKWSTSRYYQNDIDGIRVRIEAADANLMPTKIFAYQMLPIKPGNTEPLATFDHVCSVVDLEEYPEEIPNTADRPAWFRADYVDVFLRSREEVREFVNAVLEDVQILKNTLDIADELLPGGDIWIGDTTT